MKYPRIGGEVSIPLMPKLDDHHSPKSQTPSTLGMDGKSLTKCDAQNAITNIKLGGEAK